jgi:hypothetical protein
MHERDAFSAWLNAHNVDSHYLSDEEVYGSMAAPLVESSAEFVTERELEPGKSVIEITLADALEILHSEIAISIRPEQLQGYGPLSDLVDQEKLFPFIVEYDIRDFKNANAVYAKVKYNI